MVNCLQIFQVCKDVKLGLVFNFSGCLIKSNALKKSLKFIYNILTGTVGPRTNIYVIIYLKEISLLVFLLSSSRQPGILKSLTPNHLVCFNILSFKMFTAHTRPALLSKFILHIFGKHGTIYSIKNQIFYCVDWVFQVSNSSWKIMSTVIHQMELTCVS